MITNIVVDAQAGSPVLHWSPDYEHDPDPAKRRKYTVWGKTNLTDASWHSPTNSGTRFFKVDVRLP